MVDGLSFERADLMAQTAWLHALAREIAAQPADAEDAAQATSLRALQHGPRDAGRWRAFLAVALRNTLALTHRAERRRRAHERQAALSPEAATESTDDLAARLELHRHLATLVLALPTPQRELVLRHYFAGEDIAALANHTRTTTAAVRGHLHRARARLRAQLEASDGEARRGLALLLATDAGGAWLTAGALMALTTKAKIAFAALGTAAAAWLLWAQVAASGDPLVTKNGAAMAPAAGSVASVQDPTATPVRTEVPTSIAARDVPCQLVGLRPAAPWTAAVTIELEGNGATTSGSLRAEQQATPGQDGTFALHLPPWSESCGSLRFRIRAEDPLYLGVDVSDSIALASSPPVAAPIYEIAVQPVGVLTGMVVDGDGAPVPAARVLAFASIEGRPRGGSLGSANTGRGGRYHLPVAATTDVVVIAVPMREAGSRRESTPIGKHGAIADDGTRRDDLLPGWRAGASRFGSRAELEPIVVTPPAWFAGSVVHADQTPALGTRISGGPAGPAGLPSLRLWDLGPEWNSVAFWPDGRAAFSLFATVDGDGRFRLPTVGGARLQWALQLCDGPSLMQAEATAPCNLQIVVPRQPVTVRVQCGGKALPGVKLESPADREDTHHYLTTDDRGEALVLRAPGETIAFVVRPPSRPIVRASLPAEHDPRQVFEIDVPVTALTPVVLRNRGATTVHAIDMGSWVRMDVPRPTPGGAIALRFDAERGGWCCDVAPGRYRIRFSGPRDGERNDTFVLPGMAEVEVVDQGPPIEIAVQHGGRLRVLVRDQNGLGQGGLMRLIDSSGKESLPWLSCAPGHSLGEGRFSCDHGPSETIWNLPVGRYEVMLDLGAAGILKRSVEVKGCEVTEVRVDLP